jgi:hypothetical protein
MDWDGGCEDCSETDDCSIFEDDEWFEYKLCKSCAPRNKICFPCKRCNVGCLYDNTKRHGLCWECNENFLGGQKYCDLSHACTGKRADEFDSVVGELNIALGAPADDDMFKIVSDSYDDPLYCIQLKLKEIDQEAFPSTYRRAQAFYDEILADIIQTSASKKRDKASNVSSEHTEPAKKKQKTSDRDNPTI